MREDSTDPRDLTCGAVSRFGGTCVFEAGHDGDHETIDAAMFAVPPPESEHEAWVARLDLPWDSMPVLVEDERGSVVMHGVHGASGRVLAEFLTAEEAEAVAGWSRRASTDVGNNP